MKNNTRLTFKILFQTRKQIFTIHVTRVPIQGFMSHDYDDTLITIQIYFYK